ncbi:MAG: integrin alpha, partial [Halobaculum sp.]
MSSASARDSLPGGTLSGTINLTEADTTVTGQAANDSAGEEIAYGDVNGDNQTDLVVAAPANDSAGSNAGAVFVFFGPITAETVNLSAANRTLLGESSYDFAGRGLAVGYVDRDESAEIVVGAPGNDSLLADGSGPRGEDTGAAYVVDIRPRATDQNRSLATARKLRGAENGSRAGFAVAAPENVTDAGLFAVGAPSLDSRTGAVYVLDGTHTRVSNLSDARTTIRGESRNDSAGWSVAFASDVNGDRLLDILVGASTVNENTGSAYVLTAITE